MCGICVAFTRDSVSRMHGKSDILLLSETTKLTNVATCISRSDTNSDEETARQCAQTCIKHDIAYEFLQHRGPDSQNRITVKPLVTDEHVTLSFYGSVLHMRGSLCEQPFQQDGNILLWNGEIFDGLEVPNGVNDGEIFMSRLCLAHDDKSLVDIICKVEGPFAFVFYQKTLNRLWFGRDVFGRRSLVYCNQSKEFILSSVACILDKKVEWRELPSAVYCLDLISDKMSCFPWRHSAVSPVLYCAEGFNFTIHHTINPPADLLVNQTLPNTEDILEQLICSSTPLTIAQQWLNDESDLLLNVLSDSVRKRVTGSSYFCNKCGEDNSCNNAHVAVMFSGGIDSMMLAMLADKHIPQEQPIDLLNVAFEQNTSNGIDSYSVPDRLTGRTGLIELNPNRKWNFIEIDITKEELQMCREKRISQLILPLDTVLDDSIGCAMWFASRGVGTVLRSDGKRESYVSSARVVLSGLGADELLGGYSRHRGSFSQGGWEKLWGEISLDIGRISSRNLGRDDRIVSDHGKEARFPFLDENVVTTLNQLPLHKKMNLHLPRGIGEKLLLRVCAWKESLPLTATLAKRAIQFGSKIAKCENRKEKGSDKCDRIK